MATPEREHAVHIPGYSGNLSELATEVGRMRYDAVAHFLKALAAELDRQSADDTARGRRQLASRLQSVSSSVAASAADMRQIWLICKKHIPHELAKHPDLEDGT